MNTFGRSFRITTFGESHGCATGVVIDGCPSRIALSKEIIQPYLDKRRPGSSDLVTPRKESDQVEIVSGVFEGCTLGTPITLLIKNETARSSDYDHIKDIYRPSHADRAYFEKYGIRDHRGGGRSSGRETAARVAAGAVAIQLLSSHNITIKAKIDEIHGEKDPEKFADEIMQAQKKGDSVGGVVSLLISGSPSGLGDPVFGKMDAILASAMMGIGGVKGVEIGAGFSAVRMFGSEHNDQMSPEGYLSNNAGGILGGISTGQDIVMRLAIKPTPSISIPQQTIHMSGEPRTIVVSGRHDPCIAIRIIPVIEAMAALVVADLLLEQKKYFS